MDLEVHKKPYLHVKISATGPQALKEIHVLLSPLHLYHDEEKDITTLVFPSNDVDSTLRKLAGLYPEGKILEAGLSSRLETSGYHLSLPGGISLVSPEPGISPGKGEIILKRSLSFGTGHHPTSGRRPGRTTQ